MTVFSKVQIYFTAAVFVISCAYAAFSIYKRFKAAFEMDINVVTNPEDCERLIKELRRRSMEHNHNAIGFDCEWVTVGTRRNPVALLQLATYDGFCILIRLNLMEEPLPQALVNLLEDSSIYKVGLAPLNDANHLSQDYGVNTVSTLDLRHFAEMCGYRVGGLAHLTETLLGVVMDKSLDVRCSDWGAKTLTSTQLHYAASDAYAAICIFVKLLDQLDEPPYRHTWSPPDSDESVWDMLDYVCSQYADFNYKQITSPKQGGPNKLRRIKEYKEALKKKRYPHMKRTKPLYDNCFLQAPDGEVLSTIDGKKAMWYVEKGLADCINETPLTVRLRFEPAGRSVGEVGRYYTQVKENQCVVCGEKDSYIRKNVVPREYRKYFPDTMKDHSSHDIVLLCARCHQRSNMRDQTMREQLAARCHAPLPHADSGKCVEDRHCKKVRMAARALSNNKLGKCALPEERRKVLEAVVLNYFTDHTEVTDELLQQALELYVVADTEKQSGESHGQGVARHYVEREAGGLLQLEELWRAHFLSAMRPRHMPELWSATHTLDRLRVKWNEGRFTEKDLHAIGNVRWLFTTDSTSPSP